MEQHNRFWRIALLSLPLGVFGLFVIWPLFSSFYYSFTDWNGFDANYSYVGFDNFAKNATDRLYLQAAVNTTIWMIAAIVLPTALGLMLALLLDSRVAGARVFKSIFYLPICLSAVIVGQIWTWIYQPDWGLLNTVITQVTGERFKYAWLAKPETALWSVIVAWSWQQTGLSMVIYLAGLTAIPGDAIIGRMAGATLMVARAGRHPIAELEQSVKRFNHAGEQEKGFVFNDLNTDRQRYRYGYKGYVYRYSYKSPA